MRQFSNIKMAERGDSIEDIITRYSTNGGENTQQSGWFNWLPSWKPTSNEHLIESEQLILNNLTSPYTDLHVPIDEEGTTHIHTITLAPQDTPSVTPPLVMVHGFGCGLGCFYRNFDALALNRRLFAFDVLGFGRSSRDTTFGTDPETVEEDFVDSFERWRRAMGLEKMILLGHSLGAFMSCAYAMKYPERIQHLIMIEPWGFNRKPDTIQLPTQVSRSRMYMFKIAQSFTGKFNMFSPLRVSGPLGPHLITKVRPDLEEKFGEEFMKYVYHCNAQDPSGETAFWYLCLPIAWARRPMLERLNDLDPKIPISLMYGTRSWFDNSTGEKIFQARPDSYVDVHFVKGAGHHIHAEMPDIFNEIVESVCKLTLEGKDILRENEQKTQENSFFTY